MDAKQYKDGDFVEITSSIFGNIKESWESLKLNIVTLLALYLIPVAIFVVLVPFAIALGMIGDESGAGGAVGGVFFVFLILAAIVVSIMLAPAVIITLLTSVKGEKIEIADAFNKGKKYVLPLVILIILSALVIIAGFILLIIPGLLAMFFLGLAPYILIDKGVSATEAMKQSFELTKVYWKPVLAFWIVQIVISLPGIIPVFGGLITFALSIAYLCLGAYIYSVIVGKKVKRIA